MSESLPKHFPKVREAREALKARALEIQDMYMKAVQKALEAEKFEEAFEAMKFLISHMPPEDGVHMIEADRDKAKIESGPKGPQIQIGIALGGQKPKSEKILGPKVEVIEIPMESENDE